jgi:hypothetical protein
MDRTRIIAATLAGLGWASIGGCAGSTHVLTGTARPPINPADVKVYFTPPPVYQDIAALDAQRRSLFNAGEGGTDKIIARLKAEAAKVGANGLIIEGYDQVQTGSIGSGAGSDSYSAHGSMSLGLGASIGMFKTTGKGRAIFVPPGG